MSVIGILLFLLHFLHWLSEVLRVGLWELTAVTGCSVQILTYFKLSFNVFVVILFKLLR